MAENLEKLCSKLKLTDVEDTSFVVDDEGSSAPVDGAQKVIGRLLFQKPPNIRAMANAFNILWKTNKGFKINESGDSQFVNEFQSIKDKEKVLDEAPWHYDRHLVVLANMNGVMNLSHVNLNFCEFWIRLIDVPLNWRTSGILNQVDGRVGEVIDIDDYTIYMAARYVRARVRLDVTKPLIWGWSTTAKA